MLKCLYSLICLVLTSFCLAQENSTCAGMDPICTSAGLSFTANANVTGSDPGNDYGCLGSQPNPSWYYFEVATNGNIDMSLSAGSDIDFIIYGPFSSLAVAQSNCGSLGDPTNSPIVDCSFSPTNMETPSIPNAVVGDVYIMLITNYANTVQDITLTQTGGTGSTNCNIIPPCDVSVGTFSLLKNNSVVNGPIVLCKGDSYEIRSNNNYVLSNDTIIGSNNGYTYISELIFLVYTALPTTNNPIDDPAFIDKGFLSVLDDSLFDINDSLSPFSSSQFTDSLPCGTYYFVPIVVHNRLNFTGLSLSPWAHFLTGPGDCFILGDPIEVTYTCDLTPIPEVNCTGLDNGIDFSFPVDGTYNITNTGSGNLLTNVVATPSLAQLESLTHNQTYSILVTNQDGCTGQVSGQFITPQFADINVLPGPDCPGTGNGEVRVQGLVGSGNGGLGSIIMNGVSETVTVPFDTAAAQVGSVVFIRLIDQLGCYSDSSATVTSVGHDVVIELESITDVLCYGDNNGSVTINAYTIGANGLPDNVAIAGIEWTFVPTGVSSVGPPTFTTNNMLETGTWLVTVTDANGCASSLSFEIGTPDTLTLYVDAVGNPSCTDKADGSINLGYNGGTVSNSSVFSWSGPVTVPSVISSATNLIAGNYFITLTDDNGCEASISQIVEQPPPIQGLFTQTDFVKCYGDSSGFISTIGIVNAVEPFFYSWDVPGSTVQLPSTPMISNLPSGEYNLQVVDQNGCEESWLFYIDSPDSLYIDNVELFKSFCRLNSIQNGKGIISVSASGGTGSPKYLLTELNTGNTSELVTWPSRNPGPYNILVTDANGCEATKDVFLDSINPEAGFTVSSDDFEGPELYEGTEPLNVRFTNTSTGYYDPNDASTDVIFDWTFDRDPLNGNANWFFTTDSLTRPDTVYTGEQSFIACISVRNFNDCVDTACVEIISRVEPELILPNVFTPGDKPNEAFFFPNMGVTQFNATIFNRYGVPVFEFNDISEKWDGSHMTTSEACSDGVYFYTYSGTSSNGTEYSGEGTITLLRNK